MKTKPQKLVGGTKLAMDFDEAMRRSMLVKPEKKQPKRKAANRNK